MAHGASYPTEGRGRLSSWLLRRRQAERCNGEGPCSVEFHGGSDKTLIHAHSLSLTLPHAKNTDPGLGSDDHRDAFSRGRYVRATSLDGADREHAARLFADSAEATQVGDGRGPASTSQSAASAEDLRSSFLRRSSSAGDGRRQHRASWLRKLLHRRSWSEGQQGHEQPVNSSEAARDGGGGSGVNDEEEEWFSAFLDDLREKEAEAQVELEEASNTWQREDDWRDTLIERARDLGIKLPLSAIFEEPEEELAAMPDSLRWSTAF